MAFATTFRHSATEPVRGREIDANLDALGVYIDETFVPFSYMTTSPVNLSLAAGASGNALTISIKGANGSDPSSSNPVYIPFRSVTAGSGDMDVLSLTTATSIVVSSGSTLGTSNSTAFKLWLVGFNDGGTFRMGIINGRSGANTYQLSQFGIASATAEGGAGGADTVQTFYAGSAVTSKAYTVLGYLSYESGLATAGTWASDPTRVQVFSENVPLPGFSVQLRKQRNVAASTGTTAIPNDDTIPQNTEGDQYMTQAITPTSAAHLLRVRVVLNGSHSADTAWCVAVFQDSTADALFAARISSDPVAALKPVYLEDHLLAATTSATTFNVRAGSASGATFTINGEGGARVYGGAIKSFIEIEEIST